MARVDELEKVRKKRSRKRFLRRLLTLVVAVALLVSSLYLLKGGMLKVAAGRTADGLMAFLAGDAMPVSLSMGRPVWAAGVSGRIAVSDGAGLWVYTKSGRQVASHTLGYQRPAFRASGGRVLAYDLGGSRFDLFFWGERVTSKETGEAIHCADLATGGNIAVGGGSGSALSGVRVYTERGEELFRWSSSELVVSAVALGSGGSRVAFAGVSTDRGEVYSALSLYKIDEEQPMARVQLPGELVVALGYHQGRVMAVSDRRITAIDEGGRIKAAYDYPLQPVAFALSDKGQVGLVSGDYSDNHTLTATLLSADLKVEGSWEISGEVDQIGFDGGRMFLVSGEQFIRCIPGREAEAVRIPEGILALPQGDIYFLTPTHLRKAAPPQA